MNSCIVAGITKQTGAVDRRFLTLTNTYALKLNGKPFSNGGISGGFVVSGFSLIHPHSKIGVGLLSYRDGCKC